MASSYDSTTHECVDCKEIEIPSAICGNGIKEDSEYCDDNINSFGCVPHLCDCWACPPGL